MSNYDRIKSVVFQAIDEINQQLLPELQLKKSTNEILIGDNGKIDSLGLINLIVAVEEKLASEFGVHRSLVSENAFVKQESPFRTIGTFLEYICQLQYQHETN
jgi:acyl carrier protein